MYKVRNIRRITGIPSFKRSNRRLAGFREAQDEHRAPYAAETTINGTYQ